MAPLDFDDSEVKLCVINSKLDNANMLQPKQGRKSQIALGVLNNTTRREGRSAVDFEALAEFRFQLRLFLAFSEANAHKNNLTSQQYQALLTIKGLSWPNQYMS